MFESVLIADKPNLTDYLAASIRGEETKSFHIVMGKAGTGKTYHAKATCRWIAENYNTLQSYKSPLVWPSFVYMNRIAASDQEQPLTRLFSQAAQFGEIADKALDKLASYVDGCAMLFVDDVGSEKSLTPTVEAGLCTFLEQRAEGKRRKTVFTSNLGEGEILQRYGDRIHSRLFGPAEAWVMTGDDRRFK